MKHDVPPKSSGAAAVALAESPEASTAQVPSPEAAGAASPDAPGPISWDLPDSDAQAPTERPEVVPADSAATEAGSMSSSNVGTASVSMESEVSVVDADDEADVAAGDAAQAVPPPEPTVWSLGPVGRRRNIGLLVLLSVLTAGLYTILWFARANREMREFDPRMHARPGRTALAMAVPVLVSLLICAAAGARLILEHLGHGVDLPLSSTVTVWFLAAPLAAPWLALLLPFSVVGAAMTVERLRVVEDRAGTPPDLQARPVSALRSLLVPAVGILVLGVKTQARLNRVWSIALP